MFKRILVTAVALCSTVATAQTVTYIRPSKGKSLTVFKDAAVSALVQDVSPVYDWSAFGSVQVRVEVTGYLPNSPNWPDITSCQYYPIIQTLGSPELTTNAASYTIETDPTGKQPISKATYSYAVGNLSPYIKFKLTSGVGLIGILPCNVTVTIVPLPFDQNVRDIFSYVPNTGTGLYGSGRGVVKFGDFSPRMVGGLYFNLPDLIRLTYPFGYRTDASEVMFNRYDRNYALITTGGASSPLIAFSPPVTVGNATEVEVFNLGPSYGGDPQNENVSQNNVTIENVGTQPAYCAFTAKSPFSPNPPAVSSTNFTFSLKACGVAKDGTGGSKTFNSIIRDYASIRCITAAGTTDIAVQKF